MSYQSILRNLREYKDLLGLLEDEIDSELTYLREEIEDLEDKLSDEKLEIRCLESEIDRLKENQRYSVEIDDEDEKQIDIRNLSLDDKKRYFVDLICPEKSYKITTTELVKQFERFITTV